MKTVKILLAGSCLLSALAWGHGGEDHGDAAKPGALPPSGVATSGGWAATVEGAQRLPDGALFIPKAMQRQLGVRTETALAGAYARSIEWNGQVIADPGSSGLVQSTQAGRIEPGEQGLALLGSKVKRGQVLAWLVPTVSGLERSAQEASIAELQAQHALARQRLARLEQLTGSVPQKEIDAARIEVAALAARQHAVSSGLARTALRAPQDGVISAVLVRAGQVVDARSTLFEVLDPRRLAVEALAYEPLPAGGVTRAFARHGDAVFPLQFVGAGQSLREMALPVLFRFAPSRQGNGTPAALPSLAVGQWLKLVVETGVKTSGVAVPAGAVVRGANNEAMVWVHEAPERFVPHRVRTAPIDAARVLVTEGLDAGERVVNQGAPALAQIR